MDRILRAVLEGDEAEPGRVSAADVARLVLGVQTTLRRAAHVVLGRPRTATAGRYEAVIEEATKLRFVRVEHGSFAGVLSLPEPPEESPTLDLDVALQDLGYRAFQRLLDVLQNPPDHNAFVGEVSYDRTTGRATRVSLRAVVAPAEQLELSGVQFHRHRTVAELAAEQGVRGPQDLDLLRSRSVDQDELAEFAAAADQP